MYSYFNKGLNKSEVFSENIQLKYLPLTQGVKINSFSHFTFIFKVSHQVLYAKMNFLHV